MTEMSEKESEPDDAATHTAPGTASVLHESKVTREARGLDPSPSEAPPGRAGRPAPASAATPGSAALGSQCRGRCDSSGSARGSGFATAVPPEPPSHAHDTPWRA